MKPSFLLDIAKNRQPAEVLLAELKSDHMAQSTMAGQKLIQVAKESGLTLPDYLRLAVDTSKGDYAGAKLNGFEAALAYLGLPIQDNFDQGVMLQAASETFNTYPGTRALFPPVIDNILQWTYRQNNIESVDNFLAQSRGISGIEMITTVVNDTLGDYQQTGVIAEGSRIPMRSLRTSEKSIKFYKFGGGFEFTYEFERRARLDLITPYAARIRREAEIGRVAIATSLLVNGDGVSAASPVVTATALAATMAVPPTIVAGHLNWEIFLKWLINQAAAGVPIDTVVGNYDMYFEWQRMFATPTANFGISQTEILAKAGVQVATSNPNFAHDVKFALSSTAPAGKLIGLIKAETMEELVENGSEIEESQRSITNQKVQYISTKNHGYRLIFGDTRSILNLV